MSEIYLSQGHAPSVGSTEEIFFVFSWLWVVANNSWHYLARSFINPVSASVIICSEFLCSLCFTSLSPLMRTPLIRFRTHPSSV